jgi:hypothetical protein
LKICDEILHFGYEDLDLLFYDYLKAALKKIIKAAENEAILEDLELNSDSKDKHQDN